MNMIHEVFSFLLFGAQVIVGMCVLVGALLTLSFAVHLRRMPVAFFIFLLIALSGVVYGVEPLVLGHATSTCPELVFAFLVAYLLLRHGRQVRGYLERDEFWAQLHRSRSGKKEVARQLNS